MQNDVRASSPISRANSRAYRLVRSYELHDFPLIGTRGQELCLDPTDAPTDLQHPRAFQLGC